MNANRTLGALRRLSFIALAGVLALGVFLWRMPASVALLAVPGATKSALGKVIAIHEINGTLWQGSARFSTTAIVSALPLSWRCTPTLASLAIDCELSGALRGAVSVAPFADGGTLRVESLSADQAVSVAPNAALAAQSERVALDVKRASLSRAAVALEGSVVATDVTWRSGSSTLELGEVFVDCTPAADRASTNCTVKNRASATRIDGTLALNAQRVSGSLEVSPPGATAQRFSF